ncbi:MAG: hypothetical protein Q9M97_10255 [Candidatus Gracilibacteria bacterium]|nr:hypothetical protein [Candidatus Gracilibacteria bacterium]
MKSTKIASAILIAGLVSVSGVSANMHSEMNSDKTEMKKEHKMGQNSMKMDNKGNKMANHKMMMADKKAKMQEMMKPFFDKLPKETQDKLNELKAERKAHMDEEMKKYEEMRENMRLFLKSIR